MNLIDNDIPSNTLTLLKMDIDSPQDCLSKIRYESAGELVPLEKAREIKMNRNLKRFLTYTQMAIKKFPNKKILGFKSLYPLDHTFYIFFENLTQDIRIISINFSSISDLGNPEFEATHLKRWVIKYNMEIAQACIDGYNKLVSDLFQQNGELLNAIRFPKYPDVQEAFEDQWGVHKEDFMAIFGDLSTKVNTHTSKLIFILERYELKDNDIHKVKQAIDGLKQISKMTPQKFLEDLKSGNLTSV